MAAAVAHRGPDAEGLLERGDVGFAHRRLAVIDPAGSPQPMSSADGRLHVCFNGEILNHRELRAEVPYPYRTDGDTEVILAVFARWGPAGVRRLAGQFAFALYDEVAGDLWLFRDRTGILPLHWTVDAGRLLFASEVKSLLAVVERRPSLDAVALGEYLQRRYVPAPRTLLDGVHKVLPGHGLRVSATGERSTWRYWHPPEEEPLGSPAEAVPLVRDALEQSVRRNLVADVPVGAYLSGGVDSSLITALAARARGGEPLHTFAAGFGAGSVDELPHARAVSEHVGTVHHEVVLGPQDYEALWEPLTRFRDAPVAEASDVAVHRLARLAREHVTVVLSGEGADELFGGYPKHRYARATRAAGVLPSPLRRAALGRLQDRLPEHRQRLRTAVRALTADTERDRYEAWFASFTSAEVDRLLRLPRSGPVQHAVLSRGGDALRRMLLTDLAAWLPDDLLERADRMSMAVALETRPPFLDPDVVDLALRLPSSVKVRHGTTKWVVKEVARSVLPPGIADRPKAGFRAPLGTWFRSGLRDMARDRLLDPASLSAQVLDRRMVEELLRRHDAGLADEGTRIWSLVALEVWHDACFRRPSARTSAPPAQGEGA